MLTLPPGISVVVATARVDGRTIDLSEPAHVNNDAADVEDRPMRTA